MYQRAPRLFSALIIFWILVLIIPTVDWISRTGACAIDASPVWCPVYVDEMPNQWEIMR